MITGIVNAGGDAVVRLLVRGSGNILHEVEAVVDTGFNSFVSLPPNLVDALGLPYLRMERNILADGSVEECSIHEAVVLWGGREHTVPVQASGGDTLIGMAMMRGYELRIQVTDGASVTLQALP